MNRAVPDSLVEGFEPLIAGLTLPDENDRHVLAASIKCGAQIIVTYNLKDFPKTNLEQYGIEAMHPDEFIEHQMGLCEGTVVTCVKRIRERLVNPEISPMDYLKNLASQGLPVTSDKLKEFIELI